MYTIQLAIFSKTGCKTTVLAEVQHIGFRTDYLLKIIKITYKVSRTKNLRS